MKNKIVALLIFGMAFSLNLIAQTSIEGIWKGTSICQIKDSPCHNEKVVYHISKDTAANNFQVIANKIVNGKEDYMGTLKYVYDSIKGTFVCKDEPRNALWEFQINGIKMSGKLFYKNEIYRIINLKKEKDG